MLQVKFRKSLKNLKQSPTDLHFWGMLQAKFPEFANASGEIQKILKKLETVTN